MPYPRVTEILKPYTSFHNVPAEVLNRAAARGTSVHALCAGIAKGSWIPDSMIDQELLGYVMSFKKWQAVTVQNFKIIEVRYRHDELKFTGQVDFVVEKLDGTILLVDIKTSAKPQKTYPLQIAGYRVLLQKASIDVALAEIVYLDKDGRLPIVHTITDFSEDEHIFLSALDCWHYFNKGKADE